MNLELDLIDVKGFEQIREPMLALAKEIWTRPESYENVRHSIERWGTSGNESGNYFYLTKDGVRIGITGYFVPDQARGIFGLRHHGTKISGTGRAALDLLVKYIKSHHASFSGIIELIPPGREDLIPKFEEWGFRMMQDGVPEWEPKKEYYKYAMIKTE